MRNDTDAGGARADVLDVPRSSVAVYPDSDKIGVCTGNPDDNIMVRRSSGVDYYDGEAESAG